MATYLVTGATGFIGGHLARRLSQQGHHVRCLVRDPTRARELDKLGAELLPGDLRDAASLERAVRGSEVVVHLGGLTHAFFRRTLMQVNGLGTRHLTRACARQTSPPVLIYVSSIAAAGPAARHQVRTVRDRPCPISNYGCSKLAGELEVEQWADRLPVTIVRPGIVFGPAGREILPLFRCVQRWHMHAIAGYRPPRLSVIYVHDLVDLLLAAATRGRRLPASPSHVRRGQGIYFACRSEYPDYGQLGRLIQHALACRCVALLNIPAPIPWLVGGAGQLLSLQYAGLGSLNIDKIREAYAPSWACCAASARHELEFQPASSLLEQLCSTVHWYQEHGWL